MDAINLMMMLASLVLTKFSMSTSKIKGGEETMDFSSLTREQLILSLRNIIKSTQNCRKHDFTLMRRVFLTNKTVTCNDGSSAGYYIRKSSLSKKWIVFLEGGWYCFDEKSCYKRWANMRHYMSSAHWPKYREGSGILSWKPAENPYYFHANLVLIPYCSSDAWSGTVISPKGKFSFMGSVIVDEVIKDLLKHGLTKASKLILAGSSAGGTGVLINLDRVADYLSHVAPRVPIRGLVDSGWFIDNEQFIPGPCTEAQKCPPNEGIRRGMKLWQGRVPVTCGLVYDSEPWKCYFGYRLYPNLKTPVYIAQNLFDEAQLVVDNVGVPRTKEQWRYIYKTGLTIRDTLHNVSAVFAPACMSHIMLISRKWRYASISGVTLMESIHCWESRSDNNSICPLRRLFRKRIRLRHTYLKNRSGKRKFRKRHKCRRRRRKLRKRKRKTHRKARGHSQRRRRELKLPCKYRLIDKCLLQHCNYHCSGIQNILAGEEINFLDILKSR